VDSLAMDAPAMTVAALLAAVAAGAAHLGSLWWSVVLIRNGRAGLGVAVQTLRFVALAAALVLIARLGATALVAAAAGVLAARAVLMRRLRRPA
jgi:F1F0 ATPase subunit 2